MDIAALRRIAVVTLVLCIVLGSSAACTPEQQLLLTAVDKIYSEINNDDDENDKPAEGSTVIAPEGDDSPVVEEVSN